jgi:hypothetical protein
LDFENVVK